VIQVKDKRFEIFISASQLSETIARLAQRINHDYADKEPLFVAVLNGAFMFAADLMKCVTIPCRLSFVRVASYQNTQSTGILTEIIGLQENIANRHVVIIEDIVDTALTMHRLVKQLQHKQPASLQIATLLCKPEAMQKPVDLKYVGFEIPNRFVVGYGLDYDGWGRNLPDLYVLQESEE
jgi:hypoxanthine phosphoribosyltransferase